MILFTNNLNLVIKKINILSTINFSVNNGDRIGLIGKNGSGKTMLLRTLAGIYPVSINMLKKNADFFFMSVPNAGTSSRLKSKDNVKRILSLYGQNTFNENLFSDLCEQFEFKPYINYEFYKLSQGYRLRLQIIVFLMMDFQNLLIDEFFGFGDSIVQDKFLDIIENKYRNINSLIVASHNQKIIKSVCNRIIKLDQGRIIEDYRI